MPVEGQRSHLGSGFVCMSSVIVVSVVVPGNNALIAVITALHFLISASVRRRHTLLFFPLQMKICHQDGDLVIPLIVQLVRPVLWFY